MTSPSPSISGEELRACPFCGGEAWVWLDRQPPKLWCPRCRSCGADLGGFGTKAQAIAAWNRRASDTASQRIAELEAEVALGDMRASYDDLIEQHKVVLRKLRAAQSEASRWKAEAEGAREAIQVAESFLTLLANHFDLDDLTEPAERALQAARAFLSQHSEGSAPKPADERREP